MMPQANRVSQSPSIATPPGFKLAARRPQISVARIMALALAALAVGVPVVPAVSAAPDAQEVDEKWTPIATMVSPGGQATLEMHKEGVFQISYSVLQPVIEEDKKPEGGILNHGSWIISGWLETGDGDIIGCYTTADESPQSGYYEAITGVLPLVSCDGTPLGVGDYSGKTLFFEFHAIYVEHYDVKNEYDDGTWQVKVYKAFHWVQVHATNVAISVSAGLLCGGVACAIAMEIGLEIFLEVDVYDYTPQGFIQQQMAQETLPMICNNDNKFCMQSVKAPMLEGRVPVLTLPKITASWCGVPSGHDTWNEVERYFYNGGAGLNPMAQPGPYDAGEACVSLDAEAAYFGVTFSMDDAMDLLLIETLWDAPGGGSEGEDPQIVASSVHSLEMSIRAKPLEAGRTGHIAHSFGVDWDFEYAEEPQTRPRAATHYASLGTKQGYPESADFDGTLTGVTFVSTLQLAETDFIGVTGPSSENPITSAASAKGVETAVRADINEEIVATFDLIPAVLMGANPSPIELLCNDVPECTAAVLDILGCEEVDGCLVDSPCVGELFACVAELLDQLDCGDLEECEETIFCTAEAEAICGFKCLVEPGGCPITSQSSMASLAVPIEQQVMRSSSVLESQQTIMSLRAKHGEGTKVLVISDPIHRFDWNAVIADSGHESVPASQWDEIPYTPLFTIVLE